MRPIDADALVAMLYERVEECKKNEDDAKKFGVEAYNTGRATAFYDILMFVERMKPYTALKTLEEQHAQAVAERDAVNKDRINLHEQLNAALQDLRKADMVDCCHCRHYKVYDANECAAAGCTCDDCKRDCPCKTCKNNSNWEWRGIEKE